MKQLSYHFILCWFLTICVLLTGCQAAITTSPTQTASITIAPTPTATSRPTSTPIPTISEPAIIADSTTATPTLLDFLQRDSLNLALTPLPPIHKPISVDNAHRLQALAVWGNPAANLLMLSPDGENLVIGTNFGAYIYDSLTLEFQVILQTSSHVDAIAFSSDGMLIALGQAAYGIDIFEMDQFSHITHLPLDISDYEDTGELEIFFNLNDIHLVSVTNFTDRLVVNRWLSASWQTVEELAIEKDAISNINKSLEFTDLITDQIYRRQSLSYVEDFEQILLPASLTSALAVIPWHNQASILSSSDGAFVLISTGESIIYWHVNQNSITYQIGNYPPAREGGCDEVPNSCRNATGGFSFECPPDSELPPIQNVSLTLDDELMFITLNTGGAELRRTTDGTLVWKSETNFTKIAFDPDGAYFFGYTTEGVIEKHALSDGNLLDVLINHPIKLNAMDFSPDNSLLAAGYNDGWIRVYSVDDGRFLGVLQGSAASLAFSPDGSLLAAGLESGMLRIFELDEGQHFDFSGGHQDRVTSITFSQMGEQILTGSTDCTASLWGMANRNRLQMIVPSEDDPFQISAVELSMDGNSFYFAGSLNGIYAVSRAGAQDIFLSAHQGFETFTLSPYGRMLAVAGKDTFLITGLGSQISLPIEYTRLDTAFQTSASVFSPDSTLLITASSQGLEFWAIDKSVSQANRIRQAFAPVSEIAGLKISQDGKLLALAMQGGEILILAIPD